MRPQLYLLLIFAVLAGMASPRPVSAQFRQPPPYQRLVTAVRLRGLMAPTVTAARAAPIPVLAATEIPARPPALEPIYALQLAPAALLRLTFDWSRAGARVSVGLGISPF